MNVMKRGFDTLDADIDSCEGFSGDRRDAIKLCEVMNAAYKSIIPGYSTGLSSCSIYESSHQHDYEGDIPKIAKKLRLYRDSLIREQNIAEASKSEISAVASASSVSSASAYADAVAGIESLGTLTESDKAEIERLMLDVKTSKDEGMLKHAAKTLMDKAIEKGIDTLPYALSVIIKAAQNMM